MKFLSIKKQSLKVLLIEINNELLIVLFYSPILDSKVRLTIHQNSCVTLLYTDFESECRVESNGVNKGWPLLCVFDEILKTSEAISDYIRCI